MKSFEAFKKVQKYLDEEVVEIGGREYEKYYGYFVAPEGSNPDEKAFVGNMILVNKDNGKVVEMDDLSDDEYEAVIKEKWTPIDLTDVDEPEEEV